MQQSNPVKIPFFPKKRGSQNSSEWKLLEPTTGNQVPEGKSFMKGWISIDHLIALTDQQHQQEAYTFHLKDLYWSHHNIDGSKTSMSSKSCLARPGLIVDLTQYNTLNLLTFETNGDIGPKNFCLTTKDVKSSILTQLQYFSFNPHQKCVYLFGGETKSYKHDYRTDRYTQKFKKINTLYRVEIESLHVSELCTSETKPSSRSEHLTSLYDAKLYVFGGKDDENHQLSDLWVLNLPEMKWKQLKNKGVKPVFTYPTWIVAQDKSIFLYDKNDNSISSYSLNEDSWETFTPGFPPNCFQDSEFLICRDSNILFLSRASDYLAKSALYSLHISSQMDKSNGKQLENLMSQLFKEKTNADVIFKVENEEIPANKCILSLRSSHFKNAFSSDMMESHSAIIPIKDIRAEVFKAMLRYLYFADVGLNDEIAEDLFKLSHEYRLEKLKDDCEKYLMRETSVENVIKRIQFAERYEALQLRQACITLIVQNIDHFFQTQDIKELDNKTILELFRFKT